jgi:elongation factor P--(R)-beta-lysine ligase
MPSERERLAGISNNLRRRAQIYDLAREFFRERGFLEVSTPMRVPELAPEAYITPIESENWRLITSPELHMKRLLAAGYPRIFQISRCFRKGERGLLHNPEFDLLEWYATGGDYLQMIADTEGLVATIAKKLGVGRYLNYQGQKIDLKLPWPRLTVSQAFQQSAGWDPTAAYEAERFDRDMATVVIPSFSPEHPTVLTDYPAAAASLSRLKPGQTAVAERAEVFIGGLELANAFSELNDAIEQRRRFETEIAQIEHEQGRKVEMPETFLLAVGQMPAAGGIALGMERLAMLFCDAASIDEVTAFTEGNI